MTSSIPGPRKRRTRQHVIADLSVHHVEGFILQEGHTAQRFSSDYGYDLIMWTFDEQGYAEPGSVYFQLKAEESVPTGGKVCVYDLDIRDYNLWRLEKTPVILVVYEAARKRACWVHVQHYFREDTTRQPGRGAKTVRVSIPKRQPVNRRAIARIRALKQAVQRPMLEDPS